MTTLPTLRRFAVPLAVFAVSLAAFLALLGTAAPAYADEAVPLADPWTADEAVSSSSVVSGTAALTDGVALAATPAEVVYSASVYMPMVAGGAGSAQPPATMPNPAHCGPDNRDFELEMLRLVNIERAKVGAAPLVENTSLTCAAREFAKDVAINDVLSHTGTDGSLPDDRVVREGYTGELKGEVLTLRRIAPAVAVNAWMNSPGHRAILLDPTANEAGMGYAYCSTSIFHSGWVIDTGKSR